MKGNPNREANLPVVFFLIAGLTFFLSPRQAECMFSASPAWFQSAGEIPQQDRERLTALLPADQSFGFEVTEGPTFYTVENLYEYINGAADGFLDFDFQTLVQQIYQQGDTEVTVDIYDMGTAIHAFGVYASERSPDYHFISIGAEGYVEEYILNFLHGPYYVKLSAFSQAGDSGPVLEKFAREISRRIPDPARMPVEFSTLPEKGRVAYSESYVKKYPLGFEFLSPTYQVEYRVGEQTSSVVVSAAPSPDESLARARMLREHMAKTGEIASLEDWRPGAFRGSNRYQGKLVAAPEGRFLVILLNPPPEEKAFLDRIASAVEKWE